MHQKWISWVRIAASGAIFAAALLAGSDFAAAAPAPIRIAFVGNSMADGLWGAMFRRLGKDKCLAERLKLTRHGKNGTGLTRLDQFNWPAEVATLAEVPGVDLFVGSFGINDRQPIVEQDRKRVSRSPGRRSTPATRPSSRTSCATRSPRAARSSCSDCL